MPSARIRRPTSWVRRCRHQSRSRNEGSLNPARRYSFVAACWFLVGVGGAYALDCGQGGSPIENTIRSDASVRKSDAELNSLYRALRPQLTSKAQEQLLSQQRAWLAQRDQLCVSGDAACLQKAYGERIEQLMALTAAAQVSENKLAEVTPLVVKGEWKATAIRDSLPPGQGGAADVAGSLEKADLPSLGSTVKAVPGKICIPPEPCDTMGWKRTTMAKVEGGAVIGPSLGLRLDTEVYLGDSGAKQSPLLTLVPRPDGAVWAIFGLCAPAAHDCRNAAEVWTPVGRAPSLGSLP